MLSIVDLASQLYCVLGVISVSMERDGKDELVVIGDGVDSVELAKALRKKLGQAIILSVQDVKKKDDKDKEKEKAIDCLNYYYNTCPPPPYYERVVCDVPNNSCSVM